jgi:hypothetical protein
VKADGVTMTNEAYREIIRVLERAVQAGVDCVGLEYKGRICWSFKILGQLLGKHARDSKLSARWALR